MNEKRHFGTSKDGFEISEYILDNGLIEAHFLDYGCIIKNVFVAGKDGKRRDVVLGYDDLKSYEENDGYLGAFVGRVANRIKNAEFTLDGVKYRLFANDGKNCLHGGAAGFDMKVWEVLEAAPDMLKLGLVSPDGDEGFPAELKVRMTYRLTSDNRFEVEHVAQSDADTVVNLTHHSFFNLRGEGVGDVNSHVMQINADKYTPVDETLIPTGEIADVEGTPFDFREPHAIGERLGDDDEQLKLGRGYDHNWVVNRKFPEALELAARVFEPESGRELEVYTTEPGMQFYGGNFLNGEIGKSGKPYSFRGAFALETQHFPDSPNRPNFPSTLLRAGEKYCHVCSYNFSAK
mgnify:CR=1 FL=1